MAAFPNKLKMLSRRDVIEFYIVHSFITKLLNCHPRNARGTESTRGGGTSHARPRVDSGPLALCGCVIVTNQNN